MIEKALENEKESKGRITATLQGYKDEVETLKEALNIAAYSVATASMEEYGYLSEAELESLATGTTTTTTPSEIVE